MRFSTILFPLAVLASLVLASPVEERATTLAAVASAAKPKGEAGTVNVGPKAAAVHAEGSIGATVAKPGASKRSDYNELDRRGTDYGKFWVCSGYGCTGNCYWYYLPTSHCVCWWTIWYNSLYIEVDYAGVGLNYGVFAGTNCYGLFQSCTSSKGLV